MEFGKLDNLEVIMKENKITIKTIERVKIAKNYIEKKYRMKKVQEEEKKKDWDLINQKISELELNDQEAKSIKKAIKHNEANKMRISRQKMTIKDFESIALIGRGAFGEVRVCKYKETGEIFALKKIKKSEMKLKNQILHVRAEKDVLAEANDLWIIGLNYSFQDDDYLYLVMDFLPGGDLMNLFMVKDTLTEDETRFYASELIMAIESVHKMSYIHRDVKPDNVLIDHKGHLKLCDFGLSKKIDIPIYDIINNSNNPRESKNSPISNTNRRKKRILAFSTVGSPDYIAPEIILNKGYGPEIDWWSLGVIIFEMLCGYAPFSSDNPQNTCKKIMNFKRYLEFPKQIKLSPEAIDLIRKLVTDVENRLGYNGAEEIKNHPFFKNIDFNNLRNIIPPFIPEITSKSDTKYFDCIPEEEPFYPKLKTPRRIKKDIEFINFTYKRENNKDKSCISTAFKMLDSFIKNNEKKENTKNPKHSSKDKLLTLTDSTTVIDSIDNSKQIVSFSEIKKDASSNGMKSNNPICFLEPFEIDVNHERVVKSQRYKDNYAPNQNLIKNNNNNRLFSGYKNKPIIDTKITHRKTEKNIPHQMLKKILVNKDIENNMKNLMKNMQNCCISPRSTISSSQNLDKNTDIQKPINKEPFSSKNVLKKIEINLLNLDKRKSTEKINNKKENSVDKLNSPTRNEELITNRYINDFNNCETKKKNDNNINKNNKLKVLNEYVKNNLLNKTNKYCIELSSTKANMIKKSKPIQSKSEKN